jgi:serine phosphatase RsbU (regulator of sigma subunit)
LPETNSTLYQQDATTRLQGYPLFVTRGIWGILVISALSLFVISLPLYYTHLLRACTDNSNPLCSIHGTLTNTGMQELQRLGYAPATYATYTIVLSIIGAGIWSGIGLWIFWRRSDDWMALFVAYFLITYSTNLVAGPTSLLATISPGWVIVATLMSLFAVSSLGLFFCLFPDGRLVPRWVGWVVAGYIVLQIVTLFPPFRSFFSAGVQSSWLTNLIFVGFLCVLVFAQLNRYWHLKNPVQRQQTKWVVFGSSAAIVGVIGADVPYLFVHSLAQSGMLELALNSIFYLVTLPIPLSICIAMARYRLYDIDVLINRTLVYGTVTCLLVLVYFGLVIVLQRVFQPLTGGSQFTVVISTLAIAALFQPLRGSVQQTINRRFYRSRYDTGRVLASFGLAIRREIDLTVLHEQLIAVIEQTLQPIPIILHYTNYAEDRSDDPLIDYFSHNSDTVEIEQLPATLPGVEALHKDHIALVVPLISQGDLVGRLGLGPRRGGQGYSLDDRHLLNTLASQVAPAIQVAQLVQGRQKEALERERVEQELRVAQRIQHSLLPEEIPTLPGWQIATCYQPAREVGGDFYDFFPFADGRMGLVIGDVSGKGVPAALVMAATHSILHAVVKADVSPGTVLSQTNNTLYSDVPPGMFVTCFYAIIDPHSGLLRYGNAGHDLPYRHAPGSVIELQARGMPLGLMPDMEYEEQESMLRPDEGVIFYSDGLVEAHNSARDMFGFPRMMRLLSEQGAGVNLIQFFLEQLHIFTGPGWTQEDDITLVTLQRTERDKGILAHS